MPKEKRTDGVDCVCRVTSVLAARFDNLEHDKAERSGVYSEIEANQTNANARKFVTGSIES